LPSSPPRGILPPIRCPRKPWGAGIGPWGFRYWSYDRIGNRTRQNWLLSHPYTYVRNPLGGNTPLLESVRLGNELPLSTRFYTFDAGGFLTQTAVIAPFRNPEPTAHLTFDAAGTLTDLSAGGKPLTFGYDGRGLLVRAGMGDTPYALSTYSSEGRLYSLHTIDLASRKTSESRTGLLYFAGRPVAQWREAVGGGGGGALTFLTTDHLGTPACALGEDASVTWSGGFEPFGRDWQEGSAQSALANGIFLRLPGQWDHPFWHRAPLPFGFGADLYYNVHRWYEAGTGRYVSKDPYRRARLQNTYTYAASSPSRLVDRLGLFEIDPSCDCPPPPLKPDSIYKAIAQSRQFYRSAPCQEALAEHPEVKDCLGPRFGPEEIGRGPRIVCEETPNEHQPPCGEYWGTGKPNDPSLIKLFPGGAGCPQNKPDQGYGLGQTLFHEVVHSCGLLKHDTTFSKIFKACTGWTD